MKNLIFLAIFALVFSACSTKRQYFEPTNISGDAKISSLNASIKHSTRNGATLSNGTLITQNGLQSKALSANEYFLGSYEGQDVSSTIEGKLTIRQGSALVFEHQFDEAIVSASIEGNRLAALSAANKIYLLLIDTNEVILEYASGASYAQDARTAAPVFLNTIIVYPTLDGKVMIVQKDSGTIVRDAVVSSENFFNNIIYLDVEGDYLYAASGTRILSISPDRTTTIAEQIKDIKLHNGRIYVLLKNGFIKVYDLNLREIGKREFKFAIFSNIIARGNKLYIFEKTGYIIETDLNLGNERILKASEITDKSFASSNAFYYDNKMISIE